MRGGGYLLMLLAISGTGALAAHVRPVANAAEVSAPAAPASALDQAAAVRASRAVIGQQPADYALQDRANRPRAWSQFRGRPVLVNFIYTGCFHVCPTSTRALHQAVAAMRERFGTDQFQVLSIGFNPPSDSPAALREFAAQQQIDDPNWEFLSPSAADVPALARDFGFSYVPTLMGFDHTLQVSLVDANGRIREQIYGDRFTADALGEPLKRLLTGSLLSASVLSDNRLSDLIDKVRILCSVYDPRTGKYRVDYSIYLEIAGFLTFSLALLVVLVQEWRDRRTLRRAASLRRAAPLQRAVAPQ